MSEFGADQFRPSTAFVGVGSNLGDRLDCINSAARKLNGTAGVYSLESAPIYETRPIGLAGPGNFYNTVFRVEVCLSALQFLHILQDIEIGLGRSPVQAHATVGARSGARTIDLDLLFYDDLVFQNDELVIPHPYAHRREFVLRPFCDLNPDYIHPELGLSMRELMHAVAPSDQILGIIPERVVTANSPTLHDDSN